MKRRDMSKANPQTDNFVTVPPDARWRRLSRDLGGDVAPEPLGEGHPTAWAPELLTLLTSHLDPADLAALKLRAAGADLDQVAARCGLATAREAGLRIRAALKGARRPETLAAVRERLGSKTLLIAAGPAPTGDPLDTVMDSDVMWEMLNALAGACGLSSAALRDVSARTQAMGTQGRWLLFSPSGFKNSETVKQHMNSRRSLVGLGELAAMLEVSEQDAPLTALAYPELRRTRGGPWAWNGWSISARLEVTARAATARGMPSWHFSSLAAASSLEGRPISALGAASLISSAAERHTYVMSGRAGFWQLRREDQEARDNAEAITAALSGQSEMSVALITHRVRVAGKSCSRATVRAALNQSERFVRVRHGFYTLNLEDARNAHIAANRERNSKDHTPQGDVHQRPGTPEEGENT